MGIESSNTLDPNAGSPQNSEGVYVFKPKPELLWFMAVAVVTVVMQMLIEFDPAAITDWQTWAIGIGAAAVRAGAAAFITYIAKSGVVYDHKG